MLAVVVVVVTVAGGVIRMLFRPLMGVLLVGLSRLFWWEKV
jgi:hypothetical protein